MSTPVLFEAANGVATMRLASTMRWAIGQTSDAKEGPRAFAEKRSPACKGE